MVERIINGPLHTNTYLFATGRKSCIVIDPGHDAPLVWKVMERINLVPHTIVFTHGHIDHTAASSELIQHYREKEVEIRVAIHGDDAEYLGLDGEEFNRSFLPAGNPEADEVFRELFRPRPEADILLNDGDLLPESDLAVIHTPGHTRGSIFLYSESSNALFSGDSLFFDGIGRTDIEGGLNTDMEDMLREKIFSLPPGTRLYPGHGPISTLERETRSDVFKRDHGMI